MSNVKQNSQDPSSQEDEQQGTDVRNLVYSSTYEGNPREAVENPAVTPETFDQSDEFEVGLEEEDSESHHV